MGVTGVGIVVLGRDGWLVASMLSVTSISSLGDSSEVVNGFLYVAESGEVVSVPTRGTVCRRRKEFAGAKAGNRDAFWAGTPGEGPPAEIGEKNGDVGLRNSV